MTLEERRKAREKAIKEAEKEDYEKRKAERERKAEKGKKNPGCVIPSNLTEENASSLEKVTDAGKPSIEEIKARIDDAIEEYKALATESKVYDPKKPMGQFVWANTCEYVGNKVFRGKQLLQEEKNPNGGTPKLIIEKIEDVYRYYSYLTKINNSVVRICDFASFVAVSERALQQSDTIATPGQGHFAKKIKQDSENGLASMLISGRGNTTGVAMVLNVRYGWTQSREVVHTDGLNRISANELPKLGAKPTE